ncbi:uncharacterized protein LOC126320759 [Schistocerca gregaria]|uniref:uncharacterized protein LOC126320759 n=1 Tax=Schistocerca gregaria TaxID=7010 RepID=UPI00211EC324|nr:uncharacterized protein LOC126320759 [Schistocerca gregaria]
MVPTEDSGPSGDRCYLCEKIKVQRRLFPNATATNDDVNDDGSCSDNDAHNLSTSSIKSGDKSHLFFKQNYPISRNITPSLFSSQSSNQNYRGLLNLAALILFFSNFRLVMENLLKYGILINREVIASYFHIDLLMWIFCVPIFAYFMLVVERLASRNKISDFKALLCASFILLLLFFLPILVVFFKPPVPASGIILLLTSIISWMKLYSYALANRQFRLDVRKKQWIKECIEGVDFNSAVHYPHNLTLGNICYYFVSPTLCYQLNYPRTKKIRWAWVAVKFVQLIFLVCLIIFMLEQWYFPVIKNSYRFMKMAHWAILVERILKLSIPSIYIWLSGFFTLFHLWLNIVAEILRFGDREFYQDWWNATTMGYYWRTWNIPTHRWLFRHVYLPCRRLGLTREGSSLVVFFISAVIHEVLISVPLHTFKLYFFIGMLVQAPATCMGEVFKGKLAGNLIFWISFCFLGQPIGVLLYYFDYASNVLAMKQV